MNADMVLLEEWKANNDLLKFYEDLKQKRFSHFLTIQTAFLAFFALLAKEAMDKESMMAISALVLASIAPLLIALYSVRIDTRSRAQVDVINTRLLLIEKEWQGIAPEAHFSTHGQMFSVLSRHDRKTVDRYVEVRNLPNDGFRKLTGSRSAHAAEHVVLQTFLWLWMLIAAYFALHPLAQSFGFS
jgi:hypothetical protein